MLKETLRMKDDMHEDVSKEALHWRDSSQIAAESQRRLLAIELDLSNSADTLEAVQWAALLLQQMEDQERHGGVEFDNQATVEVPNEEASKKAAGEQGVSEDSVAGLRPSLLLGIDSGSKDGRADAPPTLSDRVTTPNAESLAAGLGQDDAESRGFGTGLETELGCEGNYRDMEDASRSLKKQGGLHPRKDNGDRASGSKRKLAEIVVGKILDVKRVRESDRGEKDETNGKEGRDGSLEAMMREADSGKAGAFMAERVEVRLALPQCSVLTNLISRCLLVSLDQCSPFTTGETSGNVGPSAVQEVGAHRTMEEDDFAARKEEQKRVPTTKGKGRPDKCVDGDWVWLHRWLVRTLIRTQYMESEKNKCPHCVPLDWLLAYLTAASPNLFIKVVLDDLVDDVLDCEARGLPLTPTYVRRVGILEFVALRVPEHVFSVVQSMLPHIRLPVASMEEGGTKSKQRKEGTLSVWLVMAALCPQFLGAFVRLWVPMLTLRTVQAWSGLFQGPNHGELLLPPIWSVLMGETLEEPRSMREWLGAILSRRLSELAPVGADIVLLLSHLIDALSTDGVANKLSDVSALLLNLLCMDVSKYLLPHVLGADIPTGSDRLAFFAQEGGTGVFLLVDNLRGNVHRLWSEALILCSNSTCKCCEVLADASKSVSFNLTADTKQAGVAGSEAGMNLSCQIFMEKTGVELLEKTGIERFEAVSGSRMVQLTGDTHGQLDKLDGETEPTFGTNYSASCRQGIKSRAKAQSAAIEWRGCEYGDPFVRMCHFAILSTGNYAVADLIAEATTVTPCANGGFETASLKKLLVVMRVMRMVAAQGRGPQVFEFWAQMLVTRLTMSSNKQALLRILAIRQLLDHSFWQSHQKVLGGYQRPLQAPEFEQNDEESEGLARKLVCQLLRKVLDFQWLQLLPLIHRGDAWELRLEVLGVLQLLAPDKGSRPQAVVIRLKGVLGIFIWWLDEMGDKTAMKAREDKMQAKDPELAAKWQRVRALEQLKRVIVQLAATAYSTFTLMVSSLLDYSFEHCERNPRVTSFTSSPTNMQRRTQEPSSLQRRGGVASSRGSFSVATLAAGRLDKYGNFILVSVPTLRDGHYPIPGLLLSEENRRTKSGGLSSLDIYEKERLGPSFCSGELTGPVGSPIRVEPEIMKTDDLTETKVLELGNLLQQALDRAVSNAADDPNAWPSNPANVLATLMVDRLETPHEIPMTMEQYEEDRPVKQAKSWRKRVEEILKDLNLTPQVLTLLDKSDLEAVVSKAKSVARKLSDENEVRQKTSLNLFPACDMGEDIMDNLKGLPTLGTTLKFKLRPLTKVLPKQVASIRHIFLTDCLGQNPLLLEMLELVVKWGGSREVLRCVEFIRVLLADSISCWHSAFRTRRTSSLPPTKVCEEELHDRLQVVRLIHLVADTGWLPQPLASSSEIVELIDGADIADLLLLVWRCMHHAMAFGSKSWGGSLDNSNHAAGDGQTQGADEEASKEGTYTEWEGLLFAILRQNIAQIGAHFAQVYPMRRAF